jgi:hypothetical protein
MFEWLKSLFKAPQPVGPPQELRFFTTSDPTLTQESIAPEEDVWCVNVAEQQTIRLFEIADPGIEECMLTYRAQLKTKDVQGKAYLEMWCRLPGQGEFFSKGLHNSVKGTNEWASYEIPFYLKRGQKPDLVKLNLVVEGSGTIWIKDVQLLQTPLK